LGTLVLLYFKSNSGLIGLVYLIKSNAIHLVVRYLEERYFYPTPDNALAYRRRVG
jgi:hypothetical protein